VSHIERSKHPTCVVLGWLQMAGAATAAMLLVTSGVTKVAIIVTAITAVVLAASLIVFRRR
jgi:hypothetical protein